MPTARRPVRWALIGIEALIGANAIYGGTALIRGGMGMPTEWLDQTPFGSWALPGVFLLAVVGVPMFAAAAGEILRSPWAYRVSLAAAALLLVWIVAQVLILRRYFFLQPVLFAAGLVVLGLAVWSRRSGGLDERFARGEIDDEEYRHRRAMLP